MTIRRGEGWGEQVERPTGLVSVVSDHELADLFESGRTEPIRMSSGDLHRALGSPAEREVMQRLPIDVLRVEADGRLHVAVAHVVVRSGWLTGPLLGVCNVGQMGEWNLCPRAHPNDGRFDVIEVDANMSWRDRWSARKRLALGNHVPHPHIVEHRSTNEVWQFDHPIGVWVDGTSVGKASRLSVTIEPDALVVYA